MQIKPLLPITVFGELASIKNDPKPSYISVASKSTDIDLLVPSLLVEPFGIHVAAWPTQRPQETFFPLRTVLLACHYLTMISFLEVSDTLEFRVLTGATNGCRTSIQAPWRS